MARERVNEMLATDAVVMLHVIGAAVGGKEGHALFKQLLKRLR